MNTPSRPDRPRKNAAAHATCLRHEIPARGSTDALFAEAAGISDSTLSKIFHHPDRVPNLKTLAGLSQVLDVPLRRLIELAGFPTVGANQDEYRR